MFLSFKANEKQNKMNKTYTKQDNNKVKWKDVWNYSSWNFQVTGNGARKELDDVDHTFAGGPQERVWCSVAAVSLDYKTKVVEPVGLGEGLQGVNGAR